MYLEELGKHTEETFGPNHPALAVPLARLSAAHYYNRDRKKSESCAKRALMLQRPELDIHIPWNGMTGNIVIPIIQLFNFSSTLILVYSACKYSSYVD